jgi:hypothetical protein
MSRYGVACPLVTPISKLKQTIALEKRTCFL